MHYSFLLNIKVDDSSVKGCITYDDKFCYSYVEKYCGAQTNWDVECELTGCLLAGNIKVLLLDGTYIINEYSEEDIIQEWNLSEIGNFDLKIEVGDVTASSNKTVVIIGDNDTKVLNFYIETNSKSKLYELLFLSC